MPHQRHKNIADIVRNLNFTEQNPILKAFGVSVQPTFSVIPPAKIWRPSIQMGGMVSQPKEDGNFRVNAKYLAPGSVSKWAVLYAERGVDGGAVKTLVQRLCAEAKAKGAKF